MITVLEALSAIEGALSPLGAETVPLAEACGRGLSAPAIASVTQPPAALSAMDGYAITMTGRLDAGARFDVTGEAPAGQPFNRPVGREEAVRVFTGSVMPAGTNHVVIQEQVERAADIITVSEPQPVARNVREAGGDFETGEALLPAGHTLLPRDLALCAAAGLKQLDVARAPQVAIFANGNELVSPGDKLGPGQIYNSVPFGLVPLLQSWGASVTYLGTAADEAGAVEAMFDQTSGADLVVPIGGASVGDYDLVKQTARKRFDLVFDKVAMKPGKPVWFGTSRRQAVLGLPGNPVSALVCARIFLRTALSRLQGRAVVLETMRARLGADLEPNGKKDHFLPALAGRDEDGVVIVTAEQTYDTSHLSSFAACNALIWRPAGESALSAGSLVDVLML